MPKINRPKKATARSVRLDAWHLDAIREYAYRSNRTESDTIRHFVTEGLKREGFACPSVEGAK